MCNNKIMIDINTTLHTKDGRSIGNSIVIGYSNKTNNYIIKTDYGNMFADFDYERINKMFYIGDKNNRHKHSVKRSISSIEETIKR